MEDYDNQSFHGVLHTISSIQSKISHIKDNDQEEKLNNKTNKRRSIGTTIITVIITLEV
jgi:hypothetical protein